MTTSLHISEIFNLDESECYELSADITGRVFSDWNEYHQREHYVDWMNIINLNLYKGGNEIVLSYPDIDSLYESNIFSKETIQLIEEKAEEELLNNN